MVFLVVVCGVAGAVFGRLPAAAAARAFSDNGEPLVRGGDFRHPMALPAARSATGTVVHVATAVLAAAAALVVGARWVLPAYLWFLVVTIVLTVTDVDRKLIPNRILFPGFGIAIALLGGGALLDGDPADFGRAVAGAAVYFAFLLLVALASRGGFGMGDVKLGALLGAFLAYESWAVLAVGAVGAFVLGGGVSLLLLVTRIKGRKDAIPFGPYLVAAAYVALAAGRQIADWYRG